MTEADWLACTEPEKMLESLRVRASDRKLRLFAVGCCRQIWHHLGTEESRHAVETTEGYVDGLVSMDDPISPPDPTPDPTRIGLHKYLGMLIILTDCPIAT
jgi:hypothetical protein